MQDSLKPVLDELLKITTVASGLDAELPVPVQTAIAKVAVAIEATDANEAAIFAEVQNLMAEIKGVAPAIEAAIGAVVALVKKPAPAPAVEPNPVTPAAAKE